MTQNKQEVQFTHSPNRNAIEDRPRPTVFTYFQVVHVRHVRKQDPAADGGPRHAVLHVATGRAEAHERRGEGEAVLSLGCRRSPRRRTLSCHMVRFIPTITHRVRVSVPHL